MNKELVSIIVPVYGVEKYIELALESICKQTYKNIEIILVDDETRDNSIDIAKRVLDKYPCIMYQIIREENKGLPGARNEGVKHAKGMFYCFVDSDDCIAENHIERMVNLMLEKKLDACYSEFEATSEDNRMGTLQDDDTCEVVEQEVLLKDFSMRKRQIHCCSLMISKDVFKTFQFNDKLRFGEDVEFMWRLFSHLDRIGHCNQRSYKYLIRKNSLMTTYSYEKDQVFIEEFSKTMRYLSDEFPSREELYKKAFYRNILGWMHQLSRKTTFVQFCNGIKQVDLSEMKKVLNESEDRKVRMLNNLLRFNTVLFYFALSHV